MEKSQENEFTQKKVNHVFHYTYKYETVEKILRTGFAPSYCWEMISDTEYFIPMVSFCNIPLKDVDNYLRYGKFGVGMTMEWAIKNKLSPVNYIHESTPFRNFFNMFSNFGNYTVNQEFKDMSIKVVQFMKNWKTTYEDKEIITYLEREWRYIPTMEENKIIQSGTPLFEDYKIKDNHPKPHLPNKIILIDDVTDIKYIKINTEKQREKILALLYKRFSQEKVNESIVKGQLLILTAEQLHNDF